jgi:hypothetical protein
MFGALNQLENVISPDLQVRRKNGMGYGRTHLEGRSHLPSAHKCKTSDVQVTRVHQKLTKHDTNFGWVGRTT